MATTTTTTTTLSTAEASQLNNLRGELKQWEKAFADANGGKKAGRYDIKQDPEIAAKYKIYGRLRALEESSLSSHNAGTGRQEGEKTPSKRGPNTPSRTKRKYSALTTNANEQNQTTGAENDHHHHYHHDQNDYTPRKSRREVFTPAKNRTVNDPHHPATLDPYDSPSVFRRLFSPSTHRQTQQQELSPLPLKTAVGPTPQRNGKLLGLFDMLSASGGSTATPSANRVTMLDRAVAQTPSRRKKVQGLDGIPESPNGEGNQKERKEENDDDDDEHAVAMGRTPASSSKKLYLERLFATPTTMRFATMIEDEENQSQRIPFQFGQEAAAQTNDKNPLDSGTPSFLRRSTSGRFVSNDYNDNDEDGDGFANALSPVGVRKIQRFNSKGLTALVQGLRDMENERMDDDWDVLNEIEAEQNPKPQSKGVTGRGGGGGGGGNVQVGDSQAPQYDANGDPVNNGKVWKKIGQKRTTRMVKMKPVARVNNKAPRAAAARTSKTSKTGGNVTEAENFDEDHDSEDELATLTAPPISGTDVGDQSNTEPRTRNLRERKQQAADAAEKDGDEKEEEDEDDYNDIDSDNSSDRDFDLTETTSAPTATATATATAIKAPSSFSEKLKAAFSSIPSTLKKSKDMANKDNAKSKAEQTTEPSSPKKRKINPDAHANYRSLKIRSKGQGRFKKGGRFGRR